MPTFDADALTRLGRVGAVAPSPDGAWLAVVVQRLGPDDAWASDLWRVPLDGSAPHALTRGPSRDTAPRFRADGALLFLSDRRDLAAAKADDDDGKRAQVWMLPPSGGEPVPVTDEPLGVAEYAVARDGTLALLVEVWPGVPHAEQRAYGLDRAKRGPSALHYRDTPVRHWDAWIPETGLHVVLHAAGGRRDLTPDARHEARNQPGEPGLDIAPDGSRVAVLWARPGADRIPDSCVRVLDAATGEATDLGAADRVMFVGLRFAPDGRRVAGTRVARRPRAGEHVRLWLFDGAAPGRIVADWDATPHLWDWSVDGAGLLVTCDSDGDVPVFRVDVASGAVARISARAAGGSHENLRALPDGRIAGVRHRLLSPPEPFVCASAPESTPRLLAPLSGFAEELATLATWESRQVTGDGGTPVQYFLVRPRAAAPGPRPALFWIHGGPVSQFADGWHWRWNALVAAAAGYAVALPNPRGSTGRGQAFLDGVFDNQWGGACYRDLMACADDLGRQPGIDGTRMAAMGGSFGGYMANWIGTQSERFSALVSHAGIFSFRAFHGTTDYPPYFATEMGQTPYEGDPAQFDRHSPHAFIGRWTTPTLVIHGEKDYRVPISEALLLYEALHQHRVPAELLVFPDENHWIQKPRNVRAWYAAWLDFVGRHLGAPGPSARPAPRG